MLPLAFSVHASKGVFALLLGSGISRASGIPTGWEIVLDLARQVARLKDEDCGTAPDEWYQNTYGEEPRYDKLLEMVAKSPAERSLKLRPYFDPTDDEREEGKKAPTKAHRAIAGLVAKGYIRVIVTMNFDRLLEMALAEVGITPTVISTPGHLDNAVPLAHSSCTIIKIHGDYIETTIRNTPEELVAYDPRMNALLDRVIDEYGLIVCGWSAEWDAALCEAIQRCPSHRFTTYWAARGEAGDKARAVIEKRRAQTIPIRDADGFFVELAEKITALEDMAKPHTLSAQIAVATLKRYLPDDKQQIRVHDLVMDETARVVSVLTDARFMSGLSSGELMPRLEEYQAIVDTLQAMLIAGCRWGEDRHAAIWTECLTRIATPPELSGQRERFEYVRLYPALHLLYAAGIAALAAGKTGTLARLFAQVKVRSLNDMTSVAQVLYPENVVRRDLMNVALHQNSYVPVSDYLYKTLRDPLREYLSLNEDYVRCFDLFEYWLGLLHVDSRWSGPGEHSRGPVGAFGYRYTWNGHPPMSEAIGKEAENAGITWHPLQVGLFGGSLERFREVRAAYDTHVNNGSATWG